MKTLKDIKIDESNEWNGDIDSETLQESAKEWIKGFEKEKKISIVEDKRAISEIIAWMKHFFNLEDE